MSTIRPLIIQSGSDWGWTVTINSTSGLPELVAPVMEIRRDVISASQLLARLDTSGNADGTIDVLGSGRLRMRLTHQVTANIPYGRGFWDIFCMISGQVTKVASGAVDILPHVSIYVGA